MSIDSNESYPIIDTLIQTFFSKHNNANNYEGSLVYLVVQNDHIDDENDWVCDKKIANCSTMFSLEWNEQIQECKSTLRIEIVHFSTSIVAFLSRWIDKKEWLLWILIFLTFQNISSRRGKTESLDRGNKKEQKRKKKQEVLRILDSDGTCFFHMQESHYKQL